MAARIQSSILDGMAKSPVKQAQRELVYKHITHVHASKKPMTFLGFPADNWTLEKMLLRRRKAKTLTVGVERDLMIFLRSARVMPQKGGFKTTGDLYRSSTASLLFGDILDVQQAARSKTLQDERYNQCTAVWLDCMGSLCTSVLEMLGGLHHLLDKDTPAIPLVITLFSGREKEGFSTVLSALQRDDHDPIRARAALATTPFTMLKALDFELTKAWEVATSRPSKTPAKMLYIAGILHRLT